MSEELNNNSIEESTFKKPTESEYIEDNSTIFAPREKSAEKKVKTTDSKKKLILIIVSLALAVSLALGTWLVVKFAPDSENTSSEDPSIPVVSVGIDDMQSISVEYDGAAYSYKKIDSTENDNGYIWTVSGVDNKYTSDQLLQNYAESFTSIKADRVVEYSSEGDFGFDAPSFTANVICSDESKTYTLFVGKVLDNLNQCYVRVGEQDKCYLVDYSVVENLKKTSFDFAATAVFAGIDPDECADYYVDDVLTYYDYINISGTKFTSDVRMISVVDDPNHCVYYMTSPCNRVVDANVLDGYLSMLSDGFSATGVYSYTSTDEELAKYGLKNPQAVLKIKIGSSILNIRVGDMQEDGSYPVLFNSNTPVYKFSADSYALGCVNYAVEDYVSANIITDNISSIASFRFMSNGFDKTVKLAHDPSDDTQWTATCGKDDLDVDSVRYLYQHIMLASPLVTTFDTDKGSTTLKIIVTYTDGSADKVIEFSGYNASTRRYVLSLNGQIQGIVTNEKVDNIIKAAKAVTSGETIEAPVY